MARICIFHPFGQDLKGGDEKLSFGAELGIKASRQIDVKSARKRQLLWRGLCLKYYQADEAGTRKEERDEGNDIYAPLAMSRGAVKC